MIKQFITDVYWQALDFLVIDMPPGTSDEHITLAETMKKESNVGVVLVTTPQVRLLIILLLNNFVKKKVIIF